MSHKLVVRALAELDLREAQQWYDARRPGPGREFLATIDSLLGRIAANPQRYPKAHRRIRRAVVRRFPYLVYFVVTEGVVTVIACLRRARPK